MRHRLSRNDMQALREKEFSIETLSRYSFATTEGVSLLGMYPVSAEMQPLQDRIKSMVCKFDACSNAVKEANNQELKSTSTSSASLQPNSLTIIVNKIKS